MSKKVKVILNKLKKLTQPDEFEKNLLTSIRLAKAQYHHYEKRNKLDEYGSLPRDYCDDDWSGLFAAESRLVTLQFVLRAYRTFKLNSNK